MPTCARRNCHALSYVHAPPPTSARVRAARSARRCRRPRAPRAATGCRACRGSRPGRRASRGRPSSRSAYSAHPSPCPLTHDASRRQRLSSSRRTAVCPDLQVMAGHALVIDGRLLPPGGERGDALRHRPPHAPRPRDQVVARAGVVHAAGAESGRCGTRGCGSARGCRSACRPTPPRRRRTCAASTRATPSVPFSCALAVGVQHGDRLRDARAGPDALRRRGHLGGDAREFLLAPRVGLVEIDVGAEERARVQRVTLAADGVALAGSRQQLLAQERRELLVRLARPLCRVLQRGGRVRGPRRRTGRRSRRRRRCGHTARRRRSPAGAR